MTPRDRRALVLGGAALLGALVVLRGLPWAVRSLRQLAERTERQIETAARVRVVLVRAGGVRDSLARVLGQIVALAPRLVEGRSAADAAASLAGIVSHAANRTGLKVVRLDPLPLPDSSAGVFTRVAVHAELHGDVAGLTGLLRSIEVGDPLLSVTALALTSPDPYPRGRAPEVLHLELDVSGYYLPRGTP